MVKTVETNETPKQVADRMAIGNSQTQAARVSFAGTYAKKFGADVEAQNDLYMYAESKLKTQFGPWWLYQDFQRIFTPDELAGLPTPDSENTTETPTNNPDKYKYPGKNAKGNSVQLSGSFYGDMFADLPLGKYCTAALAQCDAKLSPDRVKLQSEAELRQDGLTPEAIVEVLKINEMKSTVDIDGLKGRLYALRSNGINVCKRAARIALQMQAVRMLPKVLVQPVVNSDGTMMETDRCIRLRGPKDTPAYDTVFNITVQTFLSLRPEKALTMPNGGDVEELMSTPQRKPRGGGEESELPSIDDDEMMESYTAEYAVAVKNIKRKAHLVAMLKADNPEDDDYVLSLFAIAGELEALLSPHGKRQDRALERVNARAA